MLKSIIHPSHYTLITYNVTGGRFYCHIFRSHSPLKQRLCGRRNVTVEPSPCHIYHIEKKYPASGDITIIMTENVNDDMDISVSYVAPLNKAVEDGRHEPFLSKQVGTKQEREAILNAQQELLSRKNTLIELFKDHTRKARLKFQLPTEDIYDYCVFEFPFALWQWGTSVNSIPPKSATDREWFDYFIKISDPDYFSCPSEYTPFFVQAARELGYYGYSMKKLKKGCSVKSTKNYLKKLVLPEELSHIKFDKKLYKRTVKYLKKNDPKHIFIYGEVDPWTASGVAGWLDCKKKNNMKIYVQPNGSHKARISNMPEPMKSEIIRTLTKWLQ